MKLVKYGESQSESVSRLVVMYRPSCTGHHVHVQIGNESEFQNPKKSLNHFQIGIFAIFDYHQKGHYEYVPYGSWAKCSKMGRANAAVLPEPVLALQTMSLPLRM